MIRTRQPNDPNETGEHVGHHIRILAETLPDLVGAKLGINVIMAASTRLALMACAADANTWEGASEGKREQLLEERKGMRRRKKG